MSKHVLADPWTKSRLIPGEDLLTYRRTPDWPLVEAVFLGRTEVVFVSSYDIRWMPVDPARRRPRLIVIDAVPKLNELAIPPLLWRCRDWVLHETPHVMPVLYPCAETTWRGHLSQATERGAQAVVLTSTTEALTDWIWWCCHGGRRPKFAYPPLPPLEIPADPGDEANHEKLIWRELWAAWEQEHA